jgi:hypothetical protein
MIKIHTKRCFKMGDINDTACLLLQAYNDQRDILIISDHRTRSYVVDAMSQVVKYINTYLSMSTNVICVDDIDLIKMIDVDDLVISIGNGDISKELVEDRGAFYSELSECDLDILPFMIPEYSNAQTYQAVAC